MPLDPDDPIEFRGGLAEHNWAEVKSGHRGDGPSGHVNRHRGLKVLGKRSLMTGKAGVSAATATTTALGMKTGVVAVAGAVAAGTAVSATGVGLVAATTALTIAQSALSANSLRKTMDHLDGLKEIQKKVGSYKACRTTSTAHGDAGIYHRFIASQVLPYIIRQKTLKAVKKGVNIVPGGMLLTGLNGARRRFRKGVGLKRTFYANVLGEHLITCDCDLAVAIVISLMGSAYDTQQLMLMDLSEVTPILAPKMKSV
jgi:hypothetical protein